MQQGKEEIQPDHGSQQLAVRESRSVRRARRDLWLWPPLGPKSMRESWNRRIDETELNSPLSCSRKPKPARPGPPWPSLALPTLQWFPAIALSSCTGC